VGVAKPAASRRPIPFDLESMARKNQVLIVTVRGAKTNEAKEKEKEKK
jgi:hypothetical protein